MRKKTFVVVLATITLVACGGGSGVAASAVVGTSVSADPYHGIVVPPEPDPTVNSSTLLGVVTTGNGVRDDIVRRIAAKYGDDYGRYEAALRTARSAQIYLEANGDVAKSTAATSNAVIAGACMADRFGNGGIDALKANHYIIPLTTNTSDRMAAYAATSKASRESSTIIPSDPCL